MKNPMHKILFVLFCFLFLSIFFLISSCKNEKYTNSSNDNNREGSTKKVTENNNEINGSNFEKIDVIIGKKEYKIPLGYEIKRQKIQSRKWVKIELSLQFSIGGIIDTTFAFPTVVRTDNEGNIYVLDMRAKCIKKFNSSGEFQKKYGRQGNGPGEFQSPSRMDITPDGKIIVLDSNQNRCTIFEGDKVYQILSHLQPIGICLNNDFEFSTLQVLDPIGYAPIRRYNFNGEKIRDYQNVLMTKSLGDIFIGALPFINGELFRSKNDNLIYVPIYMNHFVKFSPDGSIQFSRNTIEDIKLPTFKRDRFDVINFRFPKEHISAYYSSLLEDHLYIVSLRETKKLADGIEYVIDSYSESNGDYEYSFKIMLDEKLSDFHATINKIYILKQDTELSVYSYTLVE
ncbi:MAG: 6-bladed beta-propeller [Ignavibacteria bacterium]|nr:6-bladed beta-propeller [Ignavibacteria bacterium]